MISKNVPRSCNVIFSSESCIPPIHKTCEHFRSINHKSLSKYSLSTFGRCYTCKIKKKDSNEYSICLICGQQNCINPDKAKNHSTNHFANNVTHCLSFNLNSFLVWCNTCQRTFLPSSLPFLKSFFAKAARFSKNNVHKNIVNSIRRATIPVGLQNLGYTCYLNSVIQCLLVLTDFRQLILELEFSNISISLTPPKYKSIQFVIGKPYGPLISGLGSLFNELMSSKKKSITPTVFRRISKIHMPNFIQFKMHDAHEYLLSLIDHISFELKKKITAQLKIVTTSFESEAITEYQKSLPSCIIESLFRGEMTSELECLSCSSKTTSVEPFFDLSLPIVAQENNIKNSELCKNEKESSFGGDAVNGVNLGLISNQRLDESHTTFSRQVESKKSSQVTRIKVQNNHQLNDSCRDPLKIDYSIEKNMSCLNLHQASTIELKSTNQPDEALSFKAYQKNFKSSTKLIDSNSLSIECLRQTHPRFARKLTEIDWRNYKLREKEEKVGYKLFSAFGKGQYYVETTVQKARLQNSFSDSCASSYQFDSQTKTASTQRFPSSSARIEDIDKNLKPRSSSQVNLHTPSLSHSKVKRYRTISNLQFSGPKINDAKIIGSLSVHDLTSYDNNSMSEQEKALVKSKAQSCSSICDNLNTQEKPDQNINNSQKSLIYNCLDSFFAPETLNKSNQILCKRCSNLNNDKVYSDAKRAYKIIKLPKFLVIHFKRFKRHNCSFIKLCDHVGFPETLDLQNYCKSETNQITKYSLTGVVEHTGSLHQGHYVSYIKCWDPGCQNEPAWFIANDHLVKLTSLRAVLQSNAYILFYSLNETRTK